jgi:hypothetical protein
MESIVEKEIEERTERVRRDTAIIKALRNKQIDTNGYR